MRAEIESAFNLVACDIYGLSEVMGPASPKNLRDEGGTTVWEDHFIAEIVDTVSGQVAADGEPGEISVHFMTKEAMPVIRLSPRAIWTRLLPGSMTAMRRMPKSAGPHDDMLVRSRVNVFPSQIEELILRLQGSRTSLRDRGHAAEPPG